MPGKRSSAWAVRGLMVDPARLMERHGFYFDLVERMAAWGLNTLWWHFADDEGFMLKLDGHPELAGPHAFSKPEMRRLLAKAAEAGVQIVPEVESLGHARAITSLPQYADLADGSGEGGFNAICPSHPRTLPLLREIIEEVAEVFPARYLHAGMDEVNVGDCPRCARRSRGRPAWRLYADHLRAINAIVTGAGKEMIVWADHVEAAPAMLRAVPTDVILAHWHYRDVPAGKIRRSVRAGFRVIGCPALCHSGDMVMPNAANYANMDAMTAAMSALRPQGRVLGVVNTWWTSWRGLRDAYLPAVAYTGKMLAARGPVGKARFFRRYVRDAFGLTDPGAGDAVRALHADALGRDEVVAALFDSLADLHRAVAMGEREALAERGRRIASATATLSKAARKVRRGREALAALVLAGEVASLCCRRVGQAAETFALYAQAERRHTREKPDPAVADRLDAALDIVNAMRDELRPVVRAVSAEWDRTRYANDPKKRFKEPLWRRSDALLVRLARAERFGAKLARDLRGAIAACRRTGRLPGGA